jgi:predicted alpha/beta-fold hydrolase
MSGRPALPADPITFLPEPDALRHAVLQALGPAPAWLPGGHAQTIWAALVARRRPAAPGLTTLRWQRERWTTPDGDFIDADWLDEAPPAADQGAELSGSAKPPGQGRPLIVLFHGLEGSTASHYVQAMAWQVRALGWRLVVPHFRGCSGELNLAPRAYHSGDFAEIAWMLARCRARAAAWGQPLVMHAAGVSLGGNALLRWAEEAGASARAVVASVAAVCSPIDLTACGLAMGQGGNRWLYTPMFLRSMKPKALAKLAQHPGLFDAGRLRAARTLYEFDDVFTAPLHGFAGTLDYWRRASAQPGLAQIRLPALVLHALNDPFVPAASLLPEAAPPPGGWVQFVRPTQGGHVGFAGGCFPGGLEGLPRALCAWMGGIAA